MKNDLEQRRALLTHLEEALKITSELGQDVCGYLIERALDEAKAANWGLDVKPGDFRPR